MPLDPNNQSKGYLFIELNSPKTPIGPGIGRVQARSHLKSWLADPQGRDQVIIYQGDDVKVAGTVETAPLTLLTNAQNGLMPIAHGLQMVQC
ncbi:hypothetical protein H4Q26_008871 [Puccinia striiformis f. sp. tritici PST-130]|nr:hypothetical protein H4Q26_008871 [Puccinia striiformis f. sp. tritici PST-130]